MAAPKQVITLKEGLPEDLAKKMTKTIRDEFKKVSRRSRAMPSACRRKAETTSRASSNTSASTRTIIPRCLAVIVGITG